VALDNAVSSSNMTGVKSDQSALPQIDELVGIVKKERIKVDVLFINGQGKIRFVPDRSILPFGAGLAWARSSLRRLQL